MIGIFDSGIGGLSVFKEIIKILPHEPAVYYADSANCPYGAKSQDEIIALSSEVVRRLLDMNCKIIAVACNTATAVAIKHLRSTFDVPFAGIEPGIKPAVLESKTGAVGVLATEGTLKSVLFNENKERFAGNVRIITVAGTGLVELVEQGRENACETEELLRRHLEPMIAEKVDCIVLGCTHYPFLSDSIRKITGDAVRQINPAPAVARQVQRLMEQRQLLSPAGSAPEYRFLSSGNTATLERMAANILPTGTKYTVQSVKYQ